MRWVLDSNVWIEAAAIDWCGFSAISRLEVLGFPNLTPVEENGLLIMLSQFNEVPIASDVIDRAIQLRRQVRMKAPEAIIAATALLGQAEVVTRNTVDFKKVTGLSVLDTQSF